MVTEVGKDEDERRRERIEEDPEPSHNFLSPAMKKPSIPDTWGRERK